MGGCHCSDPADARFHLVQLDLIDEVIRIYTDIYAQYILSSIHSV